MKLETPNPLFEKWLTEWTDEAKKKGSKAENTFKYALTNLRKYKIPLQSGQECKIIKGFGDKLCQMLDKRLNVYRKFGKNLNRSVSISNSKYGENKKKMENVKSPTKISGKVNKKSDTRKYNPQPGSGSFAILLALYKENLKSKDPHSLTKSEIINLGKQYSTSSFTKPNPGSRYTAWSSMPILIEKKLVIKESTPAKYSLTSEGYSLAEKLFKAEENKGSPDDKVYKKLSPLKLSYCSQNEIIQRNTELLGDIKKNPEVMCFDITEDPKDNFINCNGGNSNSTDCLAMPSISSKPSEKAIKKYTSSSSITSSQSSTQEECFILEPNSFDIILYVDVQETSGGVVGVEDDLLLQELGRQSILYEVKHLKIGDYVWICRDRLTNKELILPYIIERKRLDDFAHSIKDGRYHEQKFRLKKSGIQNITYLIEHYGSKHVGLPLSTLHQAAVNTAIQDEFYVKVTSNLKHTARHLAKFTKLLTVNFNSTTLVSCTRENLTEIAITDDLVSLMTFKEFNQSSSKNKPTRVTDLFVKMLIQIKGMSVDRALAIVEKYPTPALLRKAYMENPSIKGEQLLAQLQFGKFKKTIGPLLSKTVYALFTVESF